MTSLSLRNVRFRIHPCFWLVIISAIWAGYFLEILTLFGLIVIHELGHMTLARHYKWRMTEIELLPFGGVVKTDEWGTVPAKEEIIVALAGPAYNGLMVVLAAVCYLFGWWSPEWAKFFVSANMWLAGFNLLPAYPLDGGRIFQGLLSYKWPYRTCITMTLVISVTVTMGLLLGSVVPLLFGHPMMLNVGIIALFLLIANVLLWRQKSYQFMRFLMHRQMEETHADKPVVPIQVGLEDTVLATIKKWHKEAYHVIVVRDGKGDVVRVLPEEFLLQVFFDRGSPHEKLMALLD